jgi:phosphopantothenoylcysteine decarboxylase/phosphopantothenate--cysteine ligase
MTEAAKRFITPLTFSSLTSDLVASDMWSKTETDPFIQHIAWAQWAEVMVTAPATADFIAKLSCGLADDLASSIALAFMGPRVLAPAMNTGMYLNPATQANLETLKKRRHRVLESPEGLLACGTTGAGRMAEVETIALETARALGGGPLLGKKVVVTGGASQESWDDIRFLSNRSSGMMGVSLAMAAWLLGAQVIYFAGLASQVPSAPLEELEVIRYETTEGLFESLREIFTKSPPWALAMNAAPADFKPESRVKGKISKTCSELPQIKLSRTPDILLNLGEVKGDSLFIGFAAEETDLVERAKEKLLKKNLDYVAANQAGGPASAFGAENTELKLISKGHSLKTIGPVPKFQAAWELWQNIAVGWR